MSDANLNGFFNILKPSGPTSSDIVCRIKKLTKAKCGHLGTLDPLAAGVLPVAVGKAVKLFDLLAFKKKKYRARFSFGTETDTGDSEGRITAYGRIPDYGEVKSAAESFKGKIMQTPHNYSAIKIGGKKACNMARRGDVFELKSREIEIYNLDIIDYENKDFTFDIECSAGTYIRSLCRDIAKVLNTCACMTMLIRLESGAFDIKSAITLEDIENAEDFKSLLLPLEFPLKDMKKIYAEKRFYKKLYNGVPIQYDGADEDKALVYCNDELFGICQVKNGILKVNINLKKYD
jgi:tRNA pseudouridine55 synthase